MSNKNKLMQLILLSTLFSIVCSSLVLAADSTPPAGIPSSFPRINSRAEFTYIGQDTEGDSYTYIMQNYERKESRFLDLIIKITSDGILLSRALIIPDFANYANEPGTGVTEELTNFEFKDNQAIIDGFKAAKAKLTPKEYTGSGNYCAEKIIFGPSLFKSNIQKNEAPKTFSLKDVFEPKDPKKNHKFYYVSEDANYYVYLSPFYIEKGAITDCSDLLIYFNKQTRKLASYQFYTASDNKLKSPLSIEDNSAIPTQEINQVFTKAISNEGLLKSLFEKFKKLSVTLPNIFDNKPVTYTALADTSLQNDVSSRALFDHAYGYMKIAEMYRSSLNIQELPKSLEEKLGEDKKLVSSRAEAENKLGIQILSFNGVKQPDGSVMFSAQFKLKKVNQDYSFNIVVEDLREGNKVNKGLYQKRTMPLTKSTNLGTDSLRTVPLTTFSSGNLQKLSLDTNNLKSISVYVFNKKDIDMEQPFTDDNVNWTITFDTSTAPILQAKIGAGTIISPPVFDNDVKQTIILQTTKLDNQDNPSYQYKYIINLINGKSISYPDAFLSSSEVIKPLTVFYSSLGIAQSSEIKSISLVAYPFVYANYMVYSKLVYPPIPVSAKAATTPVTKDTQKNLQRLYDNWGTIIKAKAEKNSIDIALVYAIILHESVGGNENAISPSGCIGLMQVCYDSGQGTGVFNKTKLISRCMKKDDCPDDPRFDPELNIAAGTKIFADKINQFKTKTAKEEFGLASYNGGEGVIKDAIDAVIKITEGRNTNPSWVQVKPFITNNIIKANYLPKGYFGDGKNYYEDKITTKMREIKDYPAKVLQYKSQAQTFLDTKK